MKEVIDRNTDPVNKLLLAGTVPVNNLLLTGTLSNVRRCWLAMPLGAGVLHWVLACRTIERKNESLFCTPPTCVYVLNIHREFLAHFLP